MDYWFKTDKSRLYVVMAGEIDMLEVDSWRQELDKQIEKSACRQLVFDFSRVTFIDSSGLGVLLGRYKKMLQRGGEIYISGANRDVYKILLMSGLARIMYIEEPKGKEVL